MARIERFEDIRAWQEARALTNLVYDMMATGRLGRDLGLRDQIQRAAVSVMANIAEGFDRNSKKEFIKFLGYSLGSVSEVKSHLYVALDREYISAEQFKAVFAEAENVSKMLTGFIKYLRTKAK
jgi:four helix bundle protein